MTTPDLLAGFDELRARRLRNMKRSAAGLLVVAAFVFVSTFLFSDGEGLSGYVRAAAEAAMVGGIADWFAVTALFRHPLGIPIPHTALIPRGKDAIGRGLGEFVQRNFMNPDSLVARVQEADLSRRLGEWLLEPANATTAARQVASVIAAVAETINEEEVQAGIREVVTARLDQLETAPLIAGVLDRTVEGGHYESLVTAGLGGISRTIIDNRDMLRSRIHEESPWWVPGPVDDVVFEKIYVSILSFLNEVTADPGHEVRRLLDTKIKRLIADLKDSSELADRADQLKQQLIEHPDFASWTDGLWDALKQHVAAAADEPESDLRLRLENMALSTGQRLVSDADSRAKVDAWVGNLARHLAERSGPEVASLISTTVERWDADETSQRLELQVGRDLQFIRINGTLVGGLAGVIIHALVMAFGG